MGLWLFKSILTSFRSTLNLKIFLWLLRKKSNHTCAILKSHLLNLVKSIYGVFLCAMKHTLSELSNHCLGLGFPIVSEIHQQDHIDFKQKRSSKVPKEQVLYGCEGWWCCWYKRVKLTFMIHWIVRNLVQLASASFVLVLCFWFIYCMSGEITIELLLLLNY